MNKFAGLSWDWVGAKTLFMCFYRVIPYGWEKHINKIPPQSPGTIPWNVCLRGFFLYVFFSSWEKPAKPNHFVGIVPGLGWGSKSCSCVLVFDPFSCGEEEQTHKQNGQKSQGQFPDISCAYVLFSGAFCSPSWPPPLGVLWTFLSCQCVIGWQPRKASNIESAQTREKQEPCAVALSLSLSLASLGPCECGSFFALVPLSCRELCSGEIKSKVPDIIECLIFLRACSVTLSVDS